MPLLRNSWIFSHNRKFSLFFSVNELSAHYAEARHAYPTLSGSPLPLNHFGEAKLEGDMIYLPRSNFYLTRVNVSDTTTYHIYILVLFSEGRKAPTSH